MASEAVRRLVRRLPSAYTRREGSNLHKFFSVVETSAEESTIAAVRDAHVVNKAFGKSLENIGQLLNVRRRQGESDEHLRTRLKVAGATATCTATIEDVQRVVAVALQVPTSRIRVEERHDVEPAYFDVWVYLQDVMNAGLTKEELRDVLRDIKPAGVALNTKQFGTFTCRSADETSDPAKGYNDIANSNPNGGTYAGLF